MELKYIPSGDSAFIIKAGDVISEEVNLVVRKLLARLEEENIPGVTDFIPSYNELMVCYDPAIIGYRRLLETLRACAADPGAILLPAPEVVHVPVLYGGEAGPDLLHVAEYNRLAARDVITIHTSADCLVYMLGFTPGFCYLGGMNKRISTPRQETPRLKIPAGSVGIVGEQTGIYPMESPGGWQLIGRTPLRLFNPDTRPEFLFTAGDYIRFYSIDKDEYEQTIRIISGPEAHYFEVGGLRSFLSTEYTVTAQSDRMGYRLSGEPIRHKEELTNIISAGISIGTVQVPGDGQPIILMADRQTSGGYARIANVITADLTLLAQMKPGDKIRFRETTLEHARKLYLDRFTEMVGY